MSKKVSVFESILELVFGWFVLFLIIVSLFGVTSFLISLGSPSEKEFTDALEKVGYTDVKITEEAFFGCDSGDFYRKKFEGTLNGKLVKGYVCKGALKGYTIRY